MSTHENRDEKKTEEQHHFRMHAQPRIGPKRSRFSSAPPTTKPLQGISDSVASAVDNAYAVYAEYVQQGIAAAAHHLYVNPSLSGTAAGDAATHPWSLMMSNLPPGAGFNPSAPMNAFAPAMMQWMQIMQMWMNAGYSMMPALMQNLAGMGMGGMGMGGMGMPMQYPPMPGGMTSNPMGMGAYGYAPHGPGFVGQAPPSATPAPTSSASAPSTLSHSPGFAAPTDVAVSIVADRPVEITAQLGVAAHGVDLAVSPLLSTSGDGAIAIALLSDPMGRLRISVSVPRGFASGRYDVPVKDPRGNVVGSLGIVLR